jgi:hypothetical protein
MTTTEDRTAAAQGNADALRIITAAYAGGVPLDAIQARIEDNAASMLSDAQTGHGRAFAAAYDDTARDLVAELRADERAPGQIRACDLADGTPHPDDRLAAKGWRAQGGIYTRRQTEPAADREAV